MVSEQSPSWAMAGVKRVENRVDDLEEKLEAIHTEFGQLRSEFQGLEIEKLHNGIDKIPDLESSICALVRQFDDFIHQRLNLGPQPSVGSGASPNPATTSSSDKEKSIDVKNSVGLLMP